MPHTLLLADDSVTIQRVIELTFADEDIRVIAVSDGAQAVREVQADPPDIVLADVGMPEMDGYEVAAFIKGTPGLSHIPVLLLTGAFEPIDEGRARAVGCDGVLVKPFEPQMVISRVKDLLAGRPAHASAAFRPDALATLVSPALTVTAPAPATDEYFDRLDAALASFDATAATQIVPAPTPSASGAAPSASASLPSSSLLAEAFEALLAAEQGRPLESMAAQKMASSDTLIDHITRQVIERLADDRMRDAVLEVAERLVREEIARIKSTAQ